MKLNGRTVENVLVSGVDSTDYPDFCDAYFESAGYEDGTPLTDDELEELQDLHPEILNELAFLEIIG